MSVEEEYVEEEGTITPENDPQTVLIVPGDDYVIHDGEVKEEFDKVLASPKNTISNLSKHDFEREEAVLHSLRKGEFTK